MPSLNSNPRLLIAASGTGGHLFPAIAVAETLVGWHIEWLGVPDRLEQQLVPASYPLHSIQMQGFQKRLGLNTLNVLVQFIQAIVQVRRMLRRGQFDGVFTTGGYIAAPAILAARSLGLPAVIHESNAIPGKVTRWLAPLCDRVAVGFERTAQDLPRQHTVVVGTPVRSEFYQPQRLSDFNIPPEALLIVVSGGSQGAVALNRLVRDCAQAWIDAGAWIVHQTGDHDPDAESFQHPHYKHVPFYNNMAGLLQRANLAISRAGAGTLTELAITQTPAILIPFPFAAEDHQAYNAQAFEQAGAALVYRQQNLTSDQLRQAVLQLIQDTAQLPTMSHKAASLAVRNSVEQLANLITSALKRSKDV